MTPAAYPLGPSPSYTSEPTQQNANNINRVALARSIRLAAARGFKPSQPITPGQLIFTAPLGDGSRGLRCMIVLHVSRQRVLALPVFKRAGPRLDGLWAHCAGEYRRIVVERTGAAAAVYVRVPLAVLVPKGSAVRISATSVARTRSAAVVVRMAEVKTVGRVTCESWMELRRGLSRNVAGNTRN